jgi:hypothetical protein
VEGEVETRLLPGYKVSMQSGKDYFDQLDQLASDFWQWRALHQPNSSDDIPRIERPRGWEPDWSQAAVERQREALTAFSAFTPKR